VRLSTGTGRRFAQQKLFHRVLARADRWPRLQNLLRVTPHLRSFVCELEIRLSAARHSPSAEEIVHLFPRVSTVDVTLLDIRLLNHLPSLTRLVFCESWKIIRIKQECCKLRLESVTYVHRYGSKSQGPLLEWLCRGDLHRLRSASLMYVWHQHQIMARFLNQANHLRQLNIHMRLVSFHDHGGRYQRELFEYSLEPLLMMIARMQT
jgi:hypothetical protein